MLKVKRPGYAVFETRDIERQVTHFTDVIGLIDVGREAGRVHLASRSGQLAVIVEEGSLSRCKCLGLEVSPGIELASAEQFLGSLGISHTAATDPLPGISRLLSITDAQGTVIDLFGGWGFLDAPPGDVGAGALKFGHIAFFCSEPQKMVDFYASVLGFRISDWIGDYFAFMRCGADHHAVNFLKGPSAGMHHIAFEVRDAASLLRACDVLGRARRPILYGPVRHGPGHNVAAYHRNPDDQIVELYYDMDLMLDEELGHFEPRPWHRDRPQKPKVWDPSLPRDYWGLPPTAEFRRPPAAVGS